MGKSKSRGKRGAARRADQRDGIVPLGPSDERIMPVPRNLQAPKRFVFRRDDQLVTNIGGSLTFFWAGGLLANVETYLRATAGFASLVVGNYDQYYMEGFSVRYIPANRYNRGLTTATIPFCLYFDRDGISVGPSLLSSLDYGTAKVVSLDDPFELQYGMAPNTTVGQAWFDVAGASAVPLAWGTLGIASNGTTASANYGSLFWEFSIVARGRR